MADEDKKKDEIKEEDEKKTEELSDEELDTVAGGAKKIKPDSY